MRFRLYAEFLRVHLKAKMEYKFAFFSSPLILIIYYLISYLNIWIVLNKFQSIKGWEFYEILLIFNLNMLSYGFTNLIFFPMKQIGTMVQQGSFDGMLILPINPFFTVILKGFNTSFIGHIILGGIITFICLGQLEVTLTLNNFLWLVLVVLGGTLIQTGILIATAATSFWFIKSDSFILEVTQSFRKFSDYPLTIYHRWLQIFLTVIIPYAFVAFIPAQILLNKTVSDSFGTSFLIQFGTPVVGLIVFFFGYAIWVLGIRQYQSVGS